jgi:adenine-specific DNA-methyltransferase
LKPLLRGRDVKRWKVDFAEQYLIKVESSENKNHPWSGKLDGDAEESFAAIYPAIYEHFEIHRDQLIRRDDQGKYFWELRSCKYWDEFNEPKIVYPNICSRNEFSWDEDEYCRTYALTGEEKCGQFKLTV